MRNEQPARNRNVAWQAKSWRNLGVHGIDALVLGTQSPTIEEGHAFNRGGQIRLTKLFGPLGFADSKLRSSSWCWKWSQQWKLERGSGQFTKCILPTRHAEVTEKFTIKHNRSRESKTDCLSITYHEVSKQAPRPTRLKCEETSETVSTH